MWKTVLKTLGHAAVGGVAAGLAPAVSNLIPLIPHIDPATAMIVGSVASSLLSAFADPPHQDLQHKD